MLRVVWYVLCVVCCVLCVACCVYCRGLLLVNIGEEYLPRMKICWSIAGARHGEGQQSIVEGMLDNPLAT